MKRGWILAVVPIIAVLLTLQARGGDTPKSEVEALRTEVVQLKAVVDQLTRQLQAMDERLARLEGVAPVREGMPGQEPAEKVQPKVQVPERLERGSRMDPIQQEQRLREMQRRRDPASLPVPPGAPSRREEPKK